MACSLVRMRPSLVQPHFRASGQIGVPPCDPSGKCDTFESVFGTLGRNTFRGPAYYDYDFSLVKDSPIGKRAGGGDLLAVQFRSEFFNIFNIANLGLPSNTVLGTGFGLINRTAGSSRQIQFSLKVVY